MPSDPRSLDASPSAVFRHGRMTPGVFSFAPDVDEMPNGPVIVSLQRFLADSSTLLKRPWPLGVRLETAQSPELIGAELAKLALVEIHIPYFKDGRAFSWARLLRIRLQFQGEIRLSGHFLLDQIAFFQRVGVDSFVLPQSISPSQIERAVASITEVYQPSVDRRATIADLRSHRLTQAVAAE